jgi:flagellar motor switch protein FliM
LAQSNANRIQPDEDLSNEEIGELARAMTDVRTDAGYEAGRVRPYDFVHPEKLSKRNLRALEIVFSELTRTWSATLTSGLKMPVTVLVDPNEQTRFGNYVESVQEPKLVMEFLMGTLPGAVLIVLPTVVGLSLVDRVTGGPGETKGEPRPLTKIETNIVKHLIGRLMEDVANAWKPVTEVEFTFSRLYNLLEDITLDDQEPMLLTGTTWNMGSKESRIDMLMPVRCLYPTLDVLAPERWLVPDENARETPMVSVANLLKPVEIGMAIELGRTRISLEDTMSLEVGDVIRLDTNVISPLEAAIGGKVMFYARPGLVHNRLSVQIMGRAQDAASLDETVAMAESKSYTGAA